MAKHNKMTNGGNLGFEAKLFKAADKLHGKLDAAIAANLKELGYGL